MNEKPSSRLRLCNGRRATLLDHLVVWGLFATVCAILYLTLWDRWYGGHTPLWATRFHEWSNAFLPSWLHF